MFLSFFFGTYWKVFAYTVFSFSYFFLGGNFECSNRLGLEMSGSSVCLNDSVILWQCSSNVALDGIVSGHFLKSHFKE